MQRHSKCAAIHPGQATSQALPDVRPAELFFAVERCMRCLRLDCMAARRVRAVLAIGNDARTREETGNIRSLRCGAVDMGRRKGEDSIASKKRRMPFVAKIKRDDPFCPDDEREIEAMCRRVA